MKTRATLPRKPPRVATCCDLVISRWGARFRGRRFACAVGRGGVGVKRGEGDGITPIGIWRITDVYARPDRVRFDGAVARIAPDLHWVDAPDAAAYNQPIRALRPDISAERMHRPDPLYDLVAVLNVNLAPIVPGRGSAIFLHAWRKPRHPTEGCVAFQKEDLLTILQGWTPRSRVVVRPTAAVHAHQR